MISGDFMEHITGVIKEVFEIERIVSIKYKDRIIYLYFERRLMTKIDDYLAPGRFITVKTSFESRVYQGKKVIKVEEVVKIIYKSYISEKVYYSKKHIDRGIVDLVNKNTARAFLDLEMLMHPFEKLDNFEQEIIQIGLVVENSEGEVIYSCDEYIKPTLRSRVTNRTVKFLKITQNDLDSGISFDTFYKKMKYVIDTYDPVFYVWGKNDIIALDKSYKINNLTKITKRHMFIDLLAIHKTYYSLKNDLGLFKAYEMYGHEFDNQSHNAYEDALVTRDVFHGFLKECSTKL